MNRSTPGLPVHHQLVTGSHRTSQGGTETPHAGTASPRLCRTESVLPHNTPATPNQMQPTVGPQAARGHAPHIGFPGGPLQGRAQSIDVPGGGWPLQEVNAGPADGHVCLARAALATSKHRVTLPTESPDTSDAQRRPRPSSQERPSAPRQDSLP